MLYVIAIHVALPGREDDLRQALQGLVTLSRAEDGCLQYDLHEDRTSGGRFAFYEIWRDQAAFDAHAASKHLKDHGRRAPELTAKSEVFVLDRLS